MSIEVNKWYGRLGNNIIQIANVIWACNIKKIIISKLPTHKILKTRHLVSSQKFKKSHKPFTGMFFSDEHIKKSLGFSKTPSFEEKYGILHNNIKMQECLSPLLSPYDENALIIHIRSGDCFQHHKQSSQHTPTPHPDYVPPPNSYYIKCIEDHLHFTSNGNLSNVKIVTESDNYNPSVQYVSRYILDNYPNIKVDIQSTSIENDANTILNAKHLILSIGYFGYTLGLMNQNLETLYISNYMVEHEEMQKLNEVEPLLTVKLYRVEDYVSLGEWSGCDEQIEMLKTHSIEKIKPHIN